MASIVFPLASILLILAVSRPSDGIKCFDCAHPDLKSRWQLLGFPKKPSVFTSDCAGTQNGDPNSGTKVVQQTTDCASTDTFCVAIVMRALDDKGNVVTTGDPWVVRGCYDKLMEGAPRKYATKLQLAGGATSADSRELGTTTIFNLDGQATSVPMAVYSCIGATDSGGLTPCNYDTANSYLTKACTSDTKCRQPAADKKCNQWPTKTDSSCDGAYCFKYDTWASGMSMGSKGCSTVNPFVPPASTGTDTKNSLCVKYEESQYVPPYGKSQTTSYTCYCNDKDGGYCNGALGLSTPNVFFLSLCSMVATLVYFFRK